MAKKHSYIAVGPDRDGNYATIEGIMGKDGMFTFDATQGATLSIPVDRAFPTPEQATNSPDLTLKPLLAKIAKNLGSASEEPPEPPPTMRTGNPARNPFGA
jgi:hypothetical protein